MKKIILILPLLIFTNNLLAKNLFNKHLKIENRIGINLGYSMTDNIKDISGKINNSSLMFGFNSKTNVYFKNQYSIGMITNINFNSNKVSNDLIYDFIPNITKHLAKDLDIYVGAGYSLGKVYGKQDDGVSILLGVEKQFSKIMSISVEYIHTNFTITPMSKYQTSLNFKF